MTEIIILFASFFIMVFIRVPVAYALALASLLVIIYEGLNPVLFVQQMFHGLNSFPLLAVPFFLLAGQLLNSGQITERLLRLSQALVGHIRGGLAHINVVVSMLFAGMSGSSTADTAGVGSVLIPAMIKRGYDRRFTIALTAASSTMGVIIPPSILMVIYGAMGGVSIGGLFLAGAIPGAIVGLSQMVYSYYAAIRNNYPAENRASLKELGSATKAGILPLMVPIIIVGGVLTGKFTATESGMIATVYVLFLIYGIYKTMSIRRLPNILMETAVIYSQPLLAVAAATIFGWLLAYFEAPEAIAGLAGDMINSATLTVLFIAIVFVVVGTFMDAVPAIIIFLPIVDHMVQVSGANAIHTGLVVIMTLALGLITPPYGLCLLLACVLGKEPVTRVMGQMMVFYCLFAVVILIIILFPEISLWLPRLVMPKFVN
ncbi:MAG: TRAP transporter large permease [Rhodospirillales bacterium]|jgi:tripartite ATP-independent transporter DctM subunit|nr:TRAP transporter large permease [Rhodospirillales bacterium]